MYTTLSPCDMCTSQTNLRAPRRLLTQRRVGTGACLLYGVSRVVIGENKNFLGGEDCLRQRGVEVLVLNDSRCVEMMATFIAENPQLWFVSADHTLLDSHVYSSFNIDEQAP
jgi:cytosine/creatinine deaminase